MINSKFTCKSATESYEDAFWVLDMLSALVGEVPQGSALLEEEDEQLYICAES